MFITSSQVSYERFLYCTLIAGGMISPVLRMEKYFFVYVMTELLYLDLLKFKCFCHAKRGMFTTSKKYG